MLSKEQLFEISEFTRLKPHQQEKHYIQTVLLSSLYSILSKELVFKGGTALFFCYGLNRFSEDLDFTVVQPIDLKKLLATLDKDLEYLGMPKRIGKINENMISLSFKVGAEGPLYSREISRCFVDVEISKRENVEHFDVVEIKPFYPDILPFTICIMKKEEILAEKIRAIMTRNYARDIYDSYFLLHQGVAVDLHLINKKLSYYHKHFNKEEFLRKVHEKKENWESELKPLIIGELPPFKDVAKKIKSIFTSFSSRTPRA